MGLLEKLVAEAAEEAKKPKPPPEPTPFEKHRKELEDIPREVKPKGDPDKELDHVWHEHREPVMALSCPACGAERAKPCKSVEGETGRYSYMTAHPEGYAHKGRVRAFATTKGLYPEDLMKMPWRIWPHADKFKKWGVFKTNHCGEPHKRRIKKFKKFDSYESALTRADKEHEASKGPDNRWGDRFAVAPLVYIGKEEWVRWDLAPEKGETS